MSSIMDLQLEERRLLHEQRERIEMAIVEEILAKKSNHKDQLDSQHRQKKLLDRYMDCSRLLIDIYERQEQVKRPANDLSKACNDFYISMKKITDQQPNFDEDELELAEVAESSSTTAVIEIKTAERLVEFTDEEAYGRYLDLNECHEAFLQVVKYEEIKPNYLNFLQTYDQFDTLPRDKKLTHAYKKYVEQLLEYFRDYSRRAKPLFDYRELENNANEKFEELWQRRAVPGWFKDEDKEQESHSVAEPMIDLESYKSCDQLKELGLDCLKKELQVRGLKCGGTLDERAQRLWSIRGKKQHEIDDSLRSTSGGGKKNKRKQSIEPRYIASVEAKLANYAEYYDEHRQATAENVQRKQARTADERNESDDDISDVDDDEDEEQNDVIYNPKNLPLGWDGKPIPYWLYKLHGLNLTYTCEICGNATYKGPKTFQRHFAEQRHAHGMKCLGIPNTAHFANITKIQDAITLWDKLKNEKHKDQFQPLVEEEYEDSQGNVVNKKTYEDLKRQGLL